MDLEYSSQQLNFLMKKQKQSGLNSKLISMMTTDFNRSLKKKNKLSCVSRLPTYNQQIWTHKNNTIPEADGVTPFIPPNSMYPPGVLYSHLCGNVLRIFCLNSDEEDGVEDTIQFIRRFKPRGHHLDSLKPLFLKAIENAKSFIAKSDGQHRAEKRSGS